MATKQAAAVERIAIKAPDLRVLEFNVRGTSPLIQHRFYKKAALMAGMAEGSTTRSKRGKKDPRDYDKEAREACHISTDGWIGIPAAAFRNAAIDVCRLVGFKMTYAKMSVFILADGFSRDDGQPLVKVDGEWERVDMAVRNKTGVVDVRSRPMFRVWSVPQLRVRYDADQFSASDVANLMERAGLQCGIGEGRNFSKDSNGMGYGCFTVKG